MLRVRAEGEVAGLFVLVEQAAGHREYEVFEKELIGAIYRFGRILVALFLCLWQERTPLETRVSRGKELYRRQPPKSRMLGTFFGKVRYWRTYLEQVNGRPGGHYLRLSTS